MALKFTCEHCGKRLQVDQGDPNRRVTCPFCRTVVPVPAAAEPLGDAAAGEDAILPTTFRDQTDETCDEGSLLAAVAAYVPTWGTSVALHMAVILLALMSSWWTVQKPQEKVQYDTMINAATPNKYLRPPPEMTWWDKKPKPVENKDAKKGDKDKLPGRRSRTPRLALSDDASSFAMKLSANPVPDVVTNYKTRVEMIGVGGGGFVTGGIPGIGFDRGGGGGGGPGGPNIIFEPLSSAREKVVFVIDRSGSMTDSIMYVKYELKRAIRGLKPMQQFHVIFYSDGPATEMPSRKLVPATEANKLAAFDFIDGIVPVGQTDPSDALRLALAQKPDSVQLLSDGEFKANIVDLVDNLNPVVGAPGQRLVTVHTLCFIYTTGEKVLREIAKRNGGTYRYIGEYDLERLGQRD